MSDHQQPQQQLIQSLIKISGLVIGIVILLLVGSIAIVVYVNTDHTTDEIVASTSTESTKEAAANMPEEPSETAVSTYSKPTGDPHVVDGKDEQTGLLAGDGLAIVRSTCTACHSSKLVIQNHMTREQWHEKIVWMQETQGLWDLGENEKVILDYLAENYAPQPTGGRRAPLADIDWYKLEN